MARGITGTIPQAPWRPLCPTRAWSSGCAPRLSRPQFRPSNPASERACRKARAMVRPVDADPKGWRTRSQPCQQLAVLGPSHRPAHRRGRGLASPCRHDHGTGRRRRVDRKVRQSRRRGTGAAKVGGWRCFPTLMLAAGASISASSRPELIRASGVRRRLPAESAPAAASPSGRLILKKGSIVRPSASTAGNITSSA
jgi:hypothetical protein